MSGLANQSMLEWQDSGVAILPDGWHVKTVDEIKGTGKKSIISGPFGSNISSKYFVEDGVPVIRGNNLSLSVGVKFKDDGVVYITQNKAYELNTWATKDDLIFTAVGTIGQVGLLTGREQYEKYIISNKQLRLTLNRGIIDPTFAYYWFASEQMIDQIIQRNTGSNVPLINLSVLKSLLIPVPPLPDQKAIAAVLSSREDKIDLLHHQNQTLEAMAETLFRQWFVEEAQENWEAGTIADLIEFNPSRKLAKNTIAPYLEMAALSNTTFNPDGWYDREFSSGAKFINGDTLLARITPCLENGKTAYITFLEDEQVAWGSTEYIVMRPKENLHPFFAYTLARNDDFRDYAEGCLEGSSGRQRVDVAHLKNYGVKIPSATVINEFNLFAESIVPKLHSNFLQIRTLEKLRDTLLPKLMSGEVRIKLDENQ
jgi:type I restriction enzyme, S subunit